MLAVDTDVVVRFLADDDDALHLTSSRDANEGFASFDARLVKRARKHWPAAIVLTP